LSSIYYLSASEIWPGNRGGLWWEGPYKRGATVVTNISCETKINCYNQLTIKFQNRDTQF